MRESFFPTAPVALAAAVAILACACACAKPDPTPPSPGPVLLIGLDGFEWKVAGEMLRDGELPAIAALIERGHAGRLEVTRPTLSPIVWTSIATGVGADRHGVGGFVKRSKPGDKSGGRRLYTSADRKVKAFWNILSEAGRRVATIGWWLTYPAEPVEGLMVAQVNTITPALRREGRGVWKGSLVEALEGQVYPADRQPQILARLAAVEAGLDAHTREIFGELSAELGAVALDLLEQSRWAFRADAVYRDVALSVLASGESFDVFAVYFGGADVVGHRFWRHAYPQLYAHKPSAAELELLGGVVPSYYAYLDRVIAELVAAAGPETTVLIVGDHGMGPVRRGARFDEDLLSGGHTGGPPAFFVAAGPLLREPRPETDAKGAAGKARIGSILDVTPTLLALQAVPVGRDMEGTVLERLIAPELLRDHPVSYVRSHTPRSWARNRPAAELPVADVRERIEQLRALGYLD